MKSNNRVLTVLIGVIAMTLFGAMSVTAQEPKEHPEHPEGASAEHPESTAALTKDSLGDAIEMLVASFSELQGGYYCVYDDVDGTALALTLDKVHRERLASLGNGVYFACADFTATNGTTYDLDIFMTESDSGMFNGLMPTEVAVHKLDGEARYTWMEQDGTWTKKDAE